MKLATFGLSDDSAPQIRRPDFHTDIKLPAYALDGRRIRWNPDKTACVFDSTDWEYHSDGEAVSSSALKVLDRSPAHLAHSRQLRKVNPRIGETKSMAFGTAVHAAVLEPLTFSKRYVPYRGSLTASTRLTKAFKEFECALPPNVKAILPNELEAVRGASRNVLSTTVIRTETESFTMADLVSLGKAEQNYYWVDEATGLTCKARMDLTVEHILLDVKSAQDARKDRFKWDAAKFGYHIQAAFYLAGFSKFHGYTSPIMIFLVVEQTAPYATKVMPADKDSFVNEGNRRVKELLKIYKTCVTTGVWPAYSTDPELLKLPLSKLYAGNEFNY
jgi:hypothetical protein